MNGTSTLRHVIRSAKLKNVCIRNAICFLLRNVFKDMFLWWVSLSQQRFILYQISPMVYDKKYFYIVRIFSPWKLMTKWNRSVFFDSSSFPLHGSLEAILIKTNYNVIEWSKAHNFLWWTLLINDGHCPVFPTATASDTRLCPPENNAETITDLSAIFAEYTKSGSSAF